MADASTLRVASAGRPFPGEVLSGDACHVSWHADTCRLTVIDGLGHGPDAAAAADAAKAALAANTHLAPVEALQLCHTALHGTRGAAMWVGSVDVASGSITYAGVGNVDARLWQEGRQHHLVAQRGIVGATLPRVRATTAALTSRWLLVVYTDGIREKFNLGDLPPHVRDDPHQLVDTLLRAWSRPTDDALVVAIAPM